MEEIKKMCINKEECYKKFILNDQFIKLYRGIGIDKVKKDLKIEEEENCEEAILNNIFMLGCKSNYFVVQNHSISTNIDDSIYRLVEDSDEEVFKKIFKKIQEEIANNKDEFQIFVDGNREFISWLQESSKLEIAINNIQKLEHKNKILIRDYYLAVLHQFESREYHKKSALISATTKYGAAKYFMTNGFDESFKGGIIIQYILPKARIHEFAIPNFIYKNSDIIEKLEEMSLPDIKQPPYEDEEEYSVKRALFPHFILSIDLYDENIKKYKTIYNPEICKCNIEEVLKSGFSIDQGNFDEFIRKVRYKSYTQQDNDGNFKEASVD